jgi:hypothetical protein
MVRLLSVTILAASLVVLGPRASAQSDDDTDSSADDSGGADDDAGDRFSALNAQADQAAEQGDFQDAIRLWSASIQYDQSPYVECRGALQRIYIRVAEHVMDMVANGSLDDDAAFEWFKARVSNVWGNSTCNTP